MLLAVVDPGYPAVMGLADFFKRRAGHKRAKEAADQLWANLLRGRTLEIPATLSTDDVTTQAILILRQEHPRVSMTMLQSRSVVLSLGRADGVGPGPGMRVSTEAYNALARGDYFPDAQLPPEVFLGQHAAFMQRNGSDPDEMVDRAISEDRARHAITLTGSENERSGENRAVLGSEIDVPGGTPGTGSGTGSAAEPPQERASAQATQSGVERGA